MTLRARLFATSAVIALPLAIGLFLIDERLRLAQMAENLHEAVLAEFSMGLLDRCEGRGLFGRGGPPEFGGPESGGPGRGGPGRGGAGRGGPGQGRPGRESRGFQLFTYTATGTSADPDAPALPEGSVSSYWAGDGRGTELRFTIGGEGNCAIGLARMPPRHGQFRDQMVALSLIVFSVLAAAWLAAGPVISKMRRLAEGVRQSADSKYEQPVTVEGADEVAALAAAFNDAGARVRAHLVQVQAREDTLRRFVANTTHDVAVPLTVLQGYLSALGQESDRTSQPGQDLASRTLVRDAQKETHYMASLLRNLSVATKLGETSAPLVLAPVDLSALVERVIERHRPIARASGVELNFAVPDPPITVTTDATLLEQAVSNLTDNAIRYNHAGGHVAVVLDRAGDAGFVLSVTDDGPGVTEDELATLTTRWFRGSDARTRRPDGSGLGLAIASEVVDRIGLTLDFTRPSAGGLRVEIRTARA